MRANAAEISLPAVRANVRAFRRRLANRWPSPAPELCAVVKANAYGHGLAECAGAAVAAGAQWLAVTDAAEAVALRAAGVASRILVLGDFDREDAREMVRLGLTPTLWTLAQARRLAAAEQALRPRRASRESGGGGRIHPVPPRPFAVHLKVDTGMARLGTPPADLPALARQAAGMGLRVEAIYTHLASAEGPAAGAAAQMRRFALALAAVDRRISGAPGFFWHAANSAAAWRWGASQAPAAGPRQGMVRVGLGLYGHCAAPEAEKFLRPALAWKTRVIAVREIPAGAPVGYGGDRPGGWKARRRTRIATLACGYADGYFRAIANAPGAHVLLRGGRAHFAGRISMDLMSLEVTRIPAVQAGDEAVLIGAQGGHRVSSADLARWAGTIPYEVTCAIAARVPRLYR